MLKEVRSLCRCRNRVSPHPAAANARHGHSSASSMPPKDLVATPRHTHTGPSATTCNLVASLGLGHPRPWPVAAPAALPKMVVSFSEGLLATHSGPIYSMMPLSPLASTTEQHTTSTTELQGKHDADMTAFGASPKPYGCAHLFFLHNQQLPLTRV